MLISRHLVKVAMPLIKITFDPRQDVCPEFSDIEENYQLCTSSWTGFRMLVQIIRLALQPSAIWTITTAGN